MKTTIYESDCLTYCRPAIWRDGDGTPHMTPPLAWHHVEIGHDLYSQDMTDALFAEHRCSLREMFRTTWYVVCLIVPDRL